MQNKLMEVIKKEKKKSRSFRKKIVEPQKAFREECQRKFLRDLEKKIRKKKSFQKAFHTSFPEIIEITRKIPEIVALVRILEETPRVILEGSPG